MLSSHSVTVQKAGVLTRPYLVACHAALCRAVCRTVTDVSVRPLGLIIAAISVASSGMQQILCGTIQRQHKLQSHQLLANTAPVQGVMLLLLGPSVDKAVSGHWVSHYTLTTPALGCLLLSCLISVAVNISQFMCLGRFSAVTFQVGWDCVRVTHASATQEKQQHCSAACRHRSSHLCAAAMQAAAESVACLPLCLLVPCRVLVLQVLGHTKTILVLLTSWVVLHEHMSARKAFGMLLAVGGMVLYGYFNSSSYTGSSNSSSGGSGENKPLLPVASGKLPPVPSRDKLLPRSASRDVLLPDSAPLIRSSSKANRSMQDLTAVVLTAGAMAASHTTEKRPSANITPPGYAPAGSSTGGGANGLVIETR
jgi:hypothetical protein